MKFLFFTLCLFSLNLFSQNIEISVKDNLGNNAENVNVQLLKDGKIIDFQKTNDKGISIFNLSVKGVFSLKFTSLYYKTKIIEIDTSEKSYFTSILEIQITEIQEVEIKSRPKISTAKQDTIAFNLKAVRDGTERTAEELIKKLPGLSVNDNGKVTYKGNALGQILIDGNEFFGKNHKMATQNISAEMIENIDLWQSHTTINGNRSTALNLKLKDKYKGKITGNLEGNYGVKNNYLLHANLFKFGSIGNLAFITDVNNIARDPINFMDFYEMNTQEDIDNSDSNINIDIPSFLNNDGKVKSKDNQFGALQYSKSTKQINITSFLILNNTQLQKFSTSKRLSFEGQPQDFNFLERKSENNKGYFGTTQVKVRKNLSDNSFLYYNFGYNPTNDSFNQNIGRYSINADFYEVQNRVNNQNFNNYFSWNKNISKTKLIFAIHQSRDNYSENLDINSNSNLFLTNRNLISQQYQFFSNKYGANFYLKNKNKILNFNFNSGILYQKSKSELSEQFSGSNEIRSLKIYHYINDVNLYRQIGKFDLSASISSNFLNVNEFNRHYFEKKFRAVFNVDSKLINEFSFEYNSKYEIPSLKLLQYNPLYSKELSFYKNVQLTPDLLSNTNIFRLTWYRASLEKGNNLFMMLMYDKSKPTYTTNTINYGTFSAIENRIGGFRDRLILLLSNDQKFYKYYTLKSKFTAVLNQNENLIIDNGNISTMKNFELSQRIFTNYKTLPVQFELGYTFTQNIFKQSYFDTSSQQNNIKVALGIRANLKKEWIGNILGEYLIQKTEQNTVENFLIGGQISYRKEKSKFEYNLMFSNILNLNSFTYINSFTSQLGIDESSTTALHGYIIAGIKFNFD